SAQPIEFLPNAFHGTTGAVKLLVGGFLIGFGARYAGGCTSGHSITGIANLNMPSLIATICFFAGGLGVTWGLGSWLF
ncbi:MAG: YeeE/YedE family protein, partial [Planctomycetales bacterium]|nr:YeeE/YedE family protein [Planctomycetales bacterium]